MSVGSEFPGVYRLQITAVAGDGSPIEITETMSWSARHGRWWVAPVGAIDP